MNNTEITELLMSLPADLSYKKHLRDAPVSLSAEIASAIGTDKRRPVRVLKTVVEAIAAKLFVQSLTISDAAVDTAAKDWLARNDWELLERKLWEAVVRDGTTFLLVAPNSENVPTLHQIDLYDGRTGALLLDGFATNTWYKDDTRYLDIYYPNKIEKYILRDREWTKRTDMPGELWPVDWTDNENKPLGIALVPFTIGESDLANGAVQVQADINEALLDQLAVSRTQGFPQRYIKGSGSLKYITNSFGQPLLDSGGMPYARNLKLTPGSVMPVQKDEDIGQLDSAPTDTAFIDKLLHILSLITTVPTFYFTGDFPSGVALIQAETRLNGKVEEHQGHLSRGLAETIKLMLRLSNTYGTTSYDVAPAVDIVWYPPQVETEDLRLQKQESAAKNVTLLLSAGALSLQEAVRTLHPDWDETQIQIEVSRIKAEKSVIAL